MGRSAADRRMAASHTRFTPNLWAGLGDTAFSRPQPDPRSLGQQPSDVRYVHFLQQLMGHYTAYSEESAKPSP